MNVEESRQLVLTFCQHLSDLAFDKMRALTTKDATWFLNGRPDKVPYAGTFTMDEVIPRLEAFIGKLDSFSFTVTGTTAEAGRVAVEAVAHGEKDGKSYDNIYMMQYVISEGLIRSIREFFDHMSVVAYLEQ
jgi:ketosteroid isomerase-like protein